MAEPVVRLPGGGELAVFAGPDWNHWHVRVRRGGAPGAALAAAGRVAEKYRYNPAHGYPGYYLTRLVAEAVGGEAVLPPVPPTPPGAVP